MTAKQTEGYELMKGAMLYISKLTIVAMLIIGGFNFLRKACGWGLDDSDIDSWNRSGLMIHVDAKTGIQYLSDGNGGLVRRDTQK